MIADYFQYIADLLHLLSYLVLIKQIIFNKSVHGSQQLNREISYRTQEMFFLVYIFRYGDIIWNRHSKYLTAMKILYIGLTIFIIYLGYDQHADNFNHYMWIYPAIFLLTVFVHTYSEHHPFYEFCWSFSIWLEAVALIPQIKVEVITGQYLLLVGIYRMFYIIKWYICSQTGSSSS